MGFMRPVAEKMVMYHVETSCGTELVPEDVCGVLTIDGDGMLDMHSRAALQSYCEGNIGPRSYTERREGWYGRLSAPDYLDCTSWDGPYATADEALQAVQDEYEVDENGDFPNDEATPAPESEVSP
jgi:hypothetical protein